MMNFWTLCTVVATTSATGDFHFAVTPMIGYEDFYLKIRESGLPSKQFQKETAEEKRKICAAILSSSYFPWYGHHGNMLNLHDRAVRDELKLNHPDFSEAYYREPASNISYSLKRSEFANPYRLRNVTVKVPIPYGEYVFSCLSRNRGSIMVVGMLQYFVSGMYEYDLNEAVKNASEKPTVRFVFASVGRSCLEVIAMAETSAATSIFAYPGFLKGLHSQFLHEKGTTKVKPVALLTDHVVDKDANMICKLTPFQKTRLCILILNSDGYRNEFKSLPGLFDQSPQCVRHKVVYRMHCELMSSEDEWMIACKAVQVNTNKLVNRYVIRSVVTEPDKYYIGVEMDTDTIYIESYCYNVGVMFPHKNDSLNLISN